jgi:hypothetical protein
MAERCLIADALLDEGAAWDRVRVALARKQYLTGEEVKELKELVVESDVSQGKQPWHCTADMARRFLEDLRELNDATQGSDSGCGKGAEGGAAGSGRVCGADGSGAERRSARRRIAPARWPALRPVGPATSSPPF